MIKKRKIFLCFPVFRHKCLDFPTIEVRFADIIFLLMCDNIHYLRLCGMLMNGSGFDESACDQVSSDNMLYNAFGMSSEDILENFCSSSDVCL